MFRNWVKARNSLTKIVSHELWSKNKYRIPTVFLTSSSSTVFFFPGNVHGFVERRALSCYELCLWYFFLVCCRIHSDLINPYKISWAVFLVLASLMFDIGQVSLLSLCCYLLLLLLLLLLSSSNFSLLSFSWETFTYAGICNQTGIGSVVLFIILKVSYNWTYSKNYRFLHLYVRIGMQVKSF